MVVLFTAVLLIVYIFLPRITTIIILHVPLFLLDLIIPIPHGVVILGINLLFFMRPELLEQIMVFGFLSLNFLLALSLSFPSLFSVHVPIMDRSCVVTFSYAPP